MRARWQGYMYWICVCLLIVWVGLICALLVTFQPVASDWSTYYDTARALRAAPHTNLWDFSATVWGSHQSGGCPLKWYLPYKYPPLQVILIAPLTLLPCASATLIWRVVTLALWAACGAALALPAWRAGERGWALAGVALLALDLPLIYGMLLGQSHLLILTSVLLGVALIESCHEAWGGAVFAAGAWLKFLPGALVFYYLLMGRWRVAFGALIAGLTLLLAQVAVVGPASLATSLNPEMFAPGSAGGAVWDGAPGGPVWGMAAFVVFVGGVLAARRWGATEGADALGVGWALSAFLFASPIVHWFYLTWLAPAFWACLREAARIAREGRTSSGWRPWVALATTLVILGVSLIPFSQLATSVVIVSMWALCGVLYLRKTGVWAALKAARAAVVMPEAA